MDQSALFSFFPPSVLACWWLEHRTMIPKRLHPPPSVIRHLSVLDLLLPTSRVEELRGHRAFNLLVVLQNIACKNSFSLLVAYQSLLLLSPSPCSVDSWIRSEQPDEKPLTLNSQPTLTSCYLPLCSPNSPQVHDGDTGRRGAT